MEIQGPEISLSFFFKMFSCNVWQRVSFSQMTRRLAVNEVTITQDLVYQLYLLSTKFNFPIKIYESTNEKLNGNDLEILVESKGGILKIPCQAKIISKSGSFKRINHAVNGQLQIDCLIKYAKVIGGYPSYLFYNHYQRGDMNKLEDLLLPEKEFWGCSIGSAFSVKDVCNNSGKFRNPAFYDLHPRICKPLYHLADCISPKFSALKIKKLFNDINMNQVTLYSVDEVLNDPNWVDLTHRSSLGFIPPQKPILTPDKEIADIKNENIFAPQFRILLTAKNYNVATIQMLG